MPEFQRCRNNTAIGSLKGTPALYNLCFARKTSGGKINQIAQIGEFPCQSRGGRNVKTPMPVHCLLKIRNTDRFISRRSVICLLPS